MKINIEKAKVLYTLKVYYINAYGLLTTMYILLKLSLILTQFSLVSFNVFNNRKPPLTVA